MQVDGRNGKDLKLLMRTMLMNDEMPVLLLWIRTSGFLFLGLSHQTLQLSVFADQSSSANFRFLS